MFGRGHDNHHGIGRGYDRHHHHHQHAIGRGFEPHIIARPLGSFASSVGYNMYDLARREGRTRRFSDLDFGRLYTITYMWRPHPELPHHIRLQPGNFWTTLPTRENFSQQEISLTNEGWFELQCLLSGWANGVPIATIIRKNTGVCPSR
jgi:hypothetical protein